MKTRAEVKDKYRHRRNPSVSALRFYIIAALVMFALFCAWPSWGTGIFFGITALTLLGHALNVARSRRALLEMPSSHKTKGEAVLTLNSGRAVYDSENDLWNLASGETISLLVAGSRTGPSSVLVASAAWFRANAQQFQEEVTGFLLSASNRFENWPDAIEEINDLRIESIQLPWEERPTDGMVYFTGNKSDRVWRCDMMNRRPNKLGFDD